MTTVQTRQETERGAGTAPAAKRTAKNSVFLDLFQDKENLLKLYQALHPADTGATADTLTDVTVLLRRLNIAESYLPKSPSAALSSLAVATATARSSALHMKICPA